VQAQGERVMIMCFINVTVSSLCVCRISHDPAITSTQLRSELDENDKIGESRLDEVLDVQ